MVGNSTGCRAVRRDGQPCQAGGVQRNGWCAMHDPARQAQIAAARAEGGRNKSRAARAGKLVPSELRPVLAKLIAAVDQVEQGTLAAAQAGAMAALGGAIVRLYQVGVLEQRVADLEAASKGAK